MEVDRKHRTSEDEDYELSLQRRAAISNSLSILTVQALCMIPIGGFVFWLAANAALHGWLDLVPRITYGQACGVMALAWLFTATFYRRK